MVRITGLLEYFKVVNGSIEWYILYMEVST